MNRWWSDGESGKREKSGKSGKSGKRGVIFPIEWEFVIDRSFNSTNGAEFRVGVYIPLMEWSFESEFEFQCGVEIRFGNFDSSNELELTFGSLNSKLITHYSLLITHDKRQIGNLSIEL